MRSIAIGATKNRFMSEAFWYSRRRPRQSKNRNKSIRWRQTAQDLKKHSVACSKGVSAKCVHLILRRNSLGTVRSGGINSGDETGGEHDVTAGQIAIMNPSETKSTDRARLAAIARQA